MRRFLYVLGKKESKSITRACLLLIIALMIVSICGCEHRVKKTQFLFGTVADITVIAKTKDDEKAIDSAFEAMKSTDEMVSVYNVSSEVSKINQNAGLSAVKVSQDTFALIEKSIAFSQLSNGSFDVSIRPVVELWGFGTEKNQVPPDSAIEQDLPLVDYKKIILDRSNRTVKLAEKGMGIDLGAIAVGYAVDKALGVLKEKGIKNALINGGGEIYAFGSASRKKAWRVGIQHPRKHGDILGTIDLENKAISTSGDYENYFEANGKRYCHILNPKTGKPVEDIMSVTVLADNATDADALSTVIMIMGEKEGMNLAKKLGVDYIIVTGTDEKDMNIIVSDGLKDKFKLSN